MAAEPAVGAERAFGFAVAVSAGFGLAVQFAATFASNPSVAATAWILLRYFSILANLLALLAAGGRALRWRAAASPSARGGVVLILLLVAIVYQVLLAGTLTQTALDRLADLFLHRVTPALVVLDWVMTAPKGGLRWRDPLLWAAVPLLYLPYALVRGGLDGIYPYPFLDVGRFGSAQVATNAVAIAVGFLLAGAALVWVDRRLCARTRPR